MERREKMGGVIESNKCNINRDAHVDTLSFFGPL